jgi:hypothetical protein
MRERVAHAIPEAARRALRRRLLDRRRGGGEVLLWATLDHALGHLQQAHAIRDGVVQLHDRGAAPALEALDEVKLPERAILVEGLHGDGLGYVEQVAHGAVARQRGPSEVEAQVEVGIVLPPGRGESERIGHDALSQSGNEAGGAVGLGLEAGEVGPPIQDPRAEDGGAQGGVGLDVPHQGVGVAHALLEAHRALGAGFGHGVSVSDSVAVGLVDNSLDSVATNDNIVNSGDIPPFHLGSRRARRDRDVREPGGPASVVECGP